MIGAHGIRAGFDAAHRKVREQFRQRCLINQSTRTSIRPFRCKFRIRANIDRRVMMVISFCSRSIEASALPSDQKSQQQTSRYDGRPALQRARPIF